MEWGNGPQHKDFLESLIHDMKCGLVMTSPLGEPLGIPIPPRQAKGTPKSETGAACGDALRFFFLNMYVFF